MWSSTLILPAHLYGTYIFSEDATRLENSWNVSFRRTDDLPYQTHRYLVVSRQMHLQKMLIRRFLSFLKQICRSHKTIPKQLLNSIQADTRSTTGSNIRRILLLKKKEIIDQISDRDIDGIEYAEISEVDKWRVDIIKEVNDVKFGQSIIDWFTLEDCEEILEFACNS